LAAGGGWLIMSDKSVTIKFGGDIGDLQSAIEQASACVKNFGVSGTESMSALSGAIDRLSGSTVQLAVAQQASQASSQTWLSTARDLSLTAGGAAVAFEGLVKAEQGITGAIGGGIGALASCIASVGAAVHAGAEGFVAYAASLAYVDHYALVVELANIRLGGSFGRLVVAMQDWLHASEIYRSGVVALEGETIAAAGNMLKFQEAAKNSGFDNATQALQVYTEQLAKIPGMTDEAAAGIIGQIGSIQNFSGAANQALVDIIPHLSKSADDAKALARNIANAFGNPLSNGKEFLKTLGGVDAKLEAQFGAAERTLNVNKAQAALYDALIGKLQNIGAEKTREIQEELQGYQQLGVLGRFLALGIRGRLTRRSASIPNSIRRSPTFKKNPMRSAIGH
jgi:hypothetical protein